MPEQEKWSPFKAVYHYNKTKRWYIRLLPFVLGVLIFSVSYYFDGWLRHLDWQKKFECQGNWLADDELYLFKSLNLSQGQEREIGIFMGNPDRLAIGEDKLQEIKKLDGVKEVKPYFSFQSAYNLYEDNYQNTFVWRDAAHPPQVFSWLNESLLATAAGPSIYGSYSAYPYFKQAKMDSLSIAVDEAVENGAYISEVLAKKMGIGIGSLNGLTIQFEICPPLCIKDGGNLYDEGYLYTEYGKPVQITVPVRGILPDNVSGGETLKTITDMSKVTTVEETYGSIMLPYEMMEAVLMENVSYEDIGGYYVAYRPLSYMIFLNDPASAKAVAQSIFALDENLQLSGEAPVDSGTAFWLDAAKAGIHLLVFLFFAAAALLMTWYGIKRYSGVMRQDRFYSCVLWGTGLELAKILAGAVVCLPVSMVVHAWQKYSFFGAAEIGFWEYFTGNLYNPFNLLNLSVLFAVFCVFGAVMIVSAIFLHRRFEKKREVLKENPVD